MRNFRKERHNPIELINNFWPNATTEHITFDPSLKKGDYSINKESGGDGTMMFTIEMLQDCLINIVNMESVCLSTVPENWDDVIGMRYTVGLMKHATVFGMIKLKCSKTNKYPGQLERVRMPVKCEYIYKDNPNENKINTVFVPDRLCGVCTGPRNKKRRAKTGG